MRESFLAPRQSSPLLPIPVQQPSDSCSASSLPAPCWTPQTCLTTMAAGECVVCSTACFTVQYRTCSGLLYCTAACQMKDGANSLHSCLPYTVLHEERCGRLLMAARDISSGEILSHDTPAAVGPDNNPKPVCLTCYKRLPSLVYRCRHCSWPLCSPHCQQEDGPHAREYSLFQIHNPRMVIEDYKATCPS